MPEIRIYVGTSIRNPAARKGYYSWILEFDNGRQVVTRSGSGREEKSTENRLALRAIIAAVSRLTKSCSVLVFTRCTNVSAAINNRWTDEWKNDNYTSKKGRMVKNSDLWMELAEKLDSTGSRIKHCSTGGLDAVKLGTGKYEKELFELFYEEMGR